MTVDKSLMILLDCEEDSAMQQDPPHQAMMNETLLLSE